jgi:hypothetical protein
MYMRDNLLNNSAAKYMYTWKTEYLHFKGGVVIQNLIIQSAIQNFVIQSVIPNIIKTKHVSKQMYVFVI